MTPEEHEAVRLLQACTFPVASYDKRFVRSMVMALTAEITLTERQHNCLMQKVHRYRRQHGGCKCAQCLKETE